MAFRGRLMGWLLLMSETINSIYHLPFTIFHLPFHRQKNVMVNAEAISLLLILREPFINGKMKNGKW